MFNYIKMDQHLWIQINVKDANFSKMKDWVSLCHFVILQLLPLLVLCGLLSAYVLNKLKLSIFFFHNLLKIFCSFVQLTI
jgi:hypothetical protein